MGRCSATTILALGIVAAFSPDAVAAQRQPEILEPTPTDEAGGIIACDVASQQRHNPGLAGPYEVRICFAGFEVSLFAEPPDGGEPRRVPAFVVHRVEPSTAKLKTGNGRPGTWFTVPQLRERGLVATHESYLFAKPFRDRDPDWYERGHLAAKNILERLGAAPAWFTHNTANAVPQRGRFNAPAWLDLECRTGAWASGKPAVPLWVVTGPIFVGDRPDQRLYAPDGRNGPARTAKRTKPPSVAIPDFLFKIVIRQTGEEFQALGFIYPQKHRIYAKSDAAQKAETFLQPINAIEKHTGLRILRDPATDRPLSGTESSRRTPGTLWPHAIADFDRGCRRQAKET
jgi:DNA/RNA endonuclease G (NUC1)